MRTRACERLGGDGSSRRALRVLLPAMQPKPNPFGGQMKTSIYALIAVASLAMAGSASAADLGGNCCADLEERVAELEATTARKGNRKMSLTVSGQVNRADHALDTGASMAECIRRCSGSGCRRNSGTGTYLGLDNTNSSTRFGFAGNAAINPEWKAGFSILIDVGSAGRSSNASQLTEEVARWRRRSEQRPCAANA